MDDLKNIVIQNLEQEGTLGSLRAQLRAQVFKAIENYADSNTKQSAGFQWQNPIASKIHEDPENKLIALLIKEYLEHNKMDYTLNVYLPEIAMQGQQHAVARDELAERAGLAKSANQEKPLLVQLLQQLKLNPQGQNVASASGAGAAAATTSPQASTAEEVKQVSNTSKSPFRSSNTVSASGPAAGEGKGSPGGEDDIEEDIVQDHEDIQLQPNSARDAIAASGGTSTSAVGVD